MNGWDAQVYKADPGAGISCAPNTWTTLRRWEKGELAAGPTIFHAQMYATLPSTKPKDIETQWLRIGPSPDDATGATNHVVGTRAAWKGKDTNIEWLTDDDLPLELQFRHNASSIIVVKTVITKMFAPLAFAADRLTL